MTKDSKIKISFSTSSLQVTYGDKEALRMAKEAGADAVDFFTNHLSVAREGSIYTKSDEEIIAYFTEIREYAQGLGLEIPQSHGRLRIYMNDPEQDDICIENARRDLLAASVLGSPICVMHGVTTSVMGPDADPQLMHDLCYQQYSKILPWAKKYNVKIATETFGFCSALSCIEFYAMSKNFKDIYDRITAEGDNADYFKICMDTGHSNTSGRFGDLSVGDQIRLFGKNIVCLHLHDNDGKEDQHMLPMTGTIDWQDVFNALDEVGYEGTYNLEVKLPFFGKGFELETARFAVKLLRFLLEQRRL